MKLITNIALLFGFIVGNANAIIIRHDVDDNKYLQLGEQYSASVAYVGGCASTVIGNNWLLTAAHCVKGREASLFTIKHLGNKYRIASIIVHPKFDKKHDEFYDIALVHLKDPIDNGKLAKLYQLGDEIGKSVVFVGRGTFGNGSKGLIRDDGKQRGASNTIVSASEQVIGFIFNSPEQATELEGISSRGDSGGPAFINIGSQLYVAGVSSYQESNGIKEGKYGVSEYYTRVSTAYPWIKSVIETTKRVEIAKHAIIDSIKNDDLEKLTSAINKEVLTDNAIINEAFYQSVLLNRIELAKQLINQGAQAEKVVINKVSLFEFVLKNRRKEYFNMLQNETKQVKGLYSDESTVLPLLVSRFSDDANLLDNIKRVIDQGANINSKTSAGDTAIILAGWNTNNLDLVRALVKFGADLNIPNNNGDTPLMDAAYLGKIEILRYLLESGADFTLKNNSGYTALDLAIKKKNKAEEKLLLSYVNEISSD
ncbi:MAG: ankyrin repeat domain-containing protein [Colwellia sp.]|nr:ankyrin repeat domain-containing protein [Colwellia sp.]